MRYAGASRRDTDPGHRRPQSADAATGQVSETRVPGRAASTRSRAPRAEARRLMLANPLPERSVPSQPIPSSRTVSSMSRLDAVADRQRRPMAVELAARQQAHRCEQLRPETVEHGQQPDPRQRDRAGQKPPLAPPRRASSGAAYLYRYRGIRTWLGHLAAADADRAPSRQTILARPSVIDNPGTPEPGQRRAGSIVYGIPIRTVTALRVGDLARDRTGAPAVPGAHARTRCNARSRSRNAGPLAAMAFASSGKANGRAHASPANAGQLRCAVWFRLSRRPAVFCTSDLDGAVTDSKSWPLKKGSSNAP